jgi:hypothetical protein
MSVGNYDQKSLRFDPTIAHCFGFTTENTEDMEKNPRQDLQVATATRRGEIKWIGKRNRRRLRFNSIDPVHPVNPV